MDFLFDKFVFNGKVSVLKEEGVVSLLSAYALASVGGQSVGYSFHISRLGCLLVGTVEVAYPLRVYGDGSFVAGVDILCTHTQNFLDFNSSPRNLYERLLFGVRVLKNYGSGLNSDALCLSMLHDYRSSIKGSRFGRLGCRPAWSLCWWFTGEVI